MDLVTWHRVQGSGSPFLRKGQKKISADEGRGGGGRGPAGVDFSPSKPAAKDWSHHQNGTHLPTLLL